MEEQDKGVRVSNCPFGWDVCYPSCYWRKGNRCYYASKQGGRIIKPKKEGGELQLMKLAIAQMVLGVIIVTGCCLILLASLEFFSGYSATILFVNPVLGLAVLGCGVAQFLKARG